MTKLTKSILRWLKAYFTRELHYSIDKSIMLNAALLSQQHKAIYKQQINGGGGATQSRPINLQDFEFMAYSQNGEDGIIDMLIEVLGLDSSDSAFERAFVEFGVQNYTESNTRYLLKKRNFMGLIMDGAQKNMDFVKQDEIYWKHDLEAKCAFITKENIDSIIKEWLDSRGLKNIAILSVDIDGVDYFVWESIECIKPAVVIVEFNALLGWHLHISVPYRADFERFTAHHSGLYFGASLPALIELGKRKGYVFVGADSSGTNAFFIHESLADKASFDVKSIDYYCKSHNARQSRDKNGTLNFIGGDERTQMLDNMPFYDTTQDKVVYPKISKENHG